MVIIERSTNNRYGVFQSVKERENLGFEEKERNCSVIIVITSNISIIEEKYREISRDM